MDARNTHDRHGNLGHASSRDVSSRCSRAAEKFCKHAPASEPFCSKPYVDHLNPCVLPCNTCNMQVPPSSRGARSPAARPPCAAPNARTTMMRPLWLLARLWDRSRTAARCAVARAACRWAPRGRLRAACWHRLPVRSRVAYSSRDTACAPAMLLLSFMCAYGVRASWQLVAGRSDGHSVQTRPPWAVGVQASSTVPHKSWQK